MAYIEAHQSLLTHRKTLRLGRLLGMDRFCVCGRLMALWCWALDNAPDGVVAVEDADILADVVGWEREPGELCEALVAAGFFELADGFYVLHDWYVYAGKLIEKRKSDAERKRIARSGSGRPNDVQRTSSGHPADGAGTVPNRTLTDLSPEIPDGISAPAALADDAAAPPSPPPSRSEGDPGASVPGESGAVSETKPPRLRPIFGDESAPMQLARTLGAGIHRNKPDAKLPKTDAQWQSWAREFDLMLRVDHRPREKIEAVIAYAMASSFWRSVVFSAAQIRRKFDVIDAQRQEDGKRGQARVHGVGRGAGVAGAGGLERPAINSRAYYEAAARRLGQGGSCEDGGKGGDREPETAPARAAGG